MKGHEIYSKHLGPFIFATRSEAKKGSFGTLQNHGILECRTFLDFCVFSKNGRLFAYKCAHGGARNDAPHARSSCHSGQISAKKKKKFFLQKNVFFHGCREQKKSRWQKWCTPATRKTLLPSRILFFLHFFTDKSPTTSLTNGFDKTADSLRRRIFWG